MQISGSNIPDGSITLAKLASDRYTIFNASGNFDAPYTGRYFMFAIGGGGGGGAGRSIASGQNFSGEGGGAGGAGQLYQGYIDLIGGTSYAVVIGQGGAGGTPAAGTTGGSGSDGTATYFDGQLYATFGIGGLGGAGAFSGGNPGTNGAMCTGYGQGTPGATFTSANGGSAIAGLANTGAGGAGGGGCGNASAAARSGGSGASGSSGILILSW